MTTALSTALQYANLRGWACFPCIANGKEPATKNGLNDASTDPDTLRKMWRGNARANLGVRTGAPSGILVLDVDVKDGAQGRESLDQLQKEHGALPLTLRNATPSGGEHFIFRHPGGDIRNRSGFLPGLDARGDGGYILAPPSAIDGNPYRWTNEDETINEPPVWLIDLIGTQGESRLDVGAVISGLSRGTRNDQLFRYGCKLRADNIPLAEARHLMLEMASRCEPPLDPEEVLACLGSAWRYPAHTHLTDLGNAQRFVVRHGANARYLPAFKKWLSWDGARWLFDEDGEAMRLAKETALSIYAEAAGERDTERRKALGKFAAQSEGEKKLKAIVELAKTEPGIPVNVAELDKKPWLLGVANGVLDLKTGALREPNREDYITKRAHVEFVPGATCPTWLEFLDRIFAGKASLIEFVQRAAGYSLTGDTSEQCLFLLWGYGANGKSTLVNALREVLGDYATQADPAAFMARDRSGASSDIARLRGARLVAAIETEDGQRLGEAMIKQITGQDAVAARFLYAEYFEFVPTFKLWLAANHKPVVRGDDNAIWRRINLVPFTIQIPPDERDATLPEKLCAELPGIFNWAIEGCLSWQVHGLAPPDEVRAATAGYRREMDLLQDFIEARCVLLPQARVGATELYLQYKSWAQESGHGQMSQTKFGRKLAERGFEKRSTGRAIEYLGVGILDAAHDF